MDTLPGNWFWQPSCSHSTIPTCGNNTMQLSAPEDGHMVAQNNWATCKGEIKDNTKVTSSWFLIHTVYITLVTTVNCCRNASCTPLLRSDKCKVWTNWLKEGYILSLVVRTQRCALIIEVTPCKLNTRVYFLRKSLHSVVVTHIISVLIKYEGGPTKESCSLYSNTVMRWCVWFYTVLL